MAAGLVTCLPKIEKFATKKKTEKVVNPLFEKRPKQFGISIALPPNKDVHGSMRWVDLYTEHQGYDVLEMLNDDNLFEDTRDSEFEGVDKHDPLDDVKELVDFQTNGEDNVEIPKLSTDDHWLGKENS
ncbi:ribosomal protein L7A/L8 [Artemisia annua]|uniref:Ribosomal protein L7A/L8 n=1 Tax=Artemisia annua TaxID=35608 RepID=A0A2U1M6G1_ARTAN|nr:ribosomal protein L7A/L8 [Artemisia annua]